MADRKIPEINAGSMADIAFLLLVFFLVTTTIQTDAGLKVILPQWLDEPLVDPPTKNKNNVLLVVINGANQLSVNDQTNFPVENLKEETIRFINNFGQNKSFSNSPKAAVVSLQNDNATDYATFFSVYNELSAAYNAIWESEAQRLFGRPFSKLEKAKKMIIKEGPKGGWKALAKQRYGNEVSFKKLSPDQQNAIKAQVEEMVGANPKYQNGVPYEGYPKFISEAEPNDFGKEG